MTDRVRGMRIMKMNWGFSGMCGEAGAGLLISCPGPRVQHQIDQAFRRSMGGRGPHSDGAGGERVNV